MALERFVTDTSLEFVARRLRALGVDVAPAGPVALPALLERARREGRVALTTSLRHPRRFADVSVLVVRRDDPEGAVRAVAERHPPEGAPFSRCLLCNAALERHEAREARGAAPADVLRTAATLDRCPRCGRWYWHGSHVDRLRAWLAAALGRPVAAPP